MSEANHDLIRYALGPPQLLDEDDRNALIHMIDTMLTKQRMRELVAGKESA